MVVMENSFEAQQVKAFGWAARDTSVVLSPFNFFRRATGKNDVQLKVMYCGICRTDLHIMKNDWGLSTFPLVPGHEIVGIVTEVGKNVTKFEVGARVAIGALTGSCSSCENCTNNLEHFCPQFVPTTSGYQQYAGSSTFGGFCNMMVCDERFVFHIPNNLDLDATAPLLCAGISTYSPLRYFGLDKPGMRVGINGLGGLGHIAVMFAKAFGVKVTVISTSPNKEKDALGHLGADSFLLSTNPDQLQVANGTLDGILDTVFAAHPVQPLVDLLKPNGKLIFLGAHEKNPELPAFSLIMGRKMIAGSFIGDLIQTQEMLEFAAQHNVRPEFEVISMDYVNKAMERLAKADVKYKFVIDIGNTLQDC